MKVMYLLKKIWNLFKKPSPYYNKGMNSTVDGLSDLVEIGEGFISAPGSIILAHDASTIKHCSKIRVEKTIIGKNVFLGANAVILPGITVGEGAIIGAGAVVTKNVPPLVVVAGNPAKIMTPVKDYIKKCEERNVLFDVTPAVLEKHGTGLKATGEETNELINSIYSQYKKRN